MNFFSNGKLLRTVLFLGSLIAGNVFANPVLITELKVSGNATSAVIDVSYQPVSTGSGGSASFSLSNTATAKAMHASLISALAANEPVNLSINGGCVYTYCWSTVEIVDL